MIRLCIPADISAATASTILNATLNARAAVLNRNVYFDARIGYSVRGCQTLVRDGNADIVKIGSSDMYDAFLDFNGLRPYATEDFLAGLTAGVEYYAVAAVKKARTPAWSKLLREVSLLWQVLPRVCS